MSKYENESLEKLKSSLKALERINERRGEPLKSAENKIKEIKAEIKRREEEEESKSKKSTEEAAEKAAKKVTDKDSKKDSSKKKEEKKEEGKKPEPHKFHFRIFDKEDGQVFKQDTISGWEDKTKAEAKKLAKEFVEDMKEDEAYVVEISEKAFTSKPKASKKPQAKKTTTAKKKEQKTHKLVVDGKEYVFGNENDKNECEKALKAVKAKAKEEKEHKEAREKGREEARKIPVTRRISDSFATVTRKVISEAKRNDDNKEVSEIKKTIDEVEKAFSNLFDKLELLMGKKIPKAQRDSIMNILQGYESKFEEEKKEEIEKSEGKKDKAKAKRRVKKEEGGFAETEPDNSWSYMNLM